MGAGLRASAGAGASCAPAPATIGPTAAKNNNGQILNGDDGCKGFPPAASVAGRRAAGAQHARITVARRDKARLTNRVKSEDEEKTPAADAPKRGAAHRRTLRQAEAGGARPRREQGTNRGRSEWPGGPSRPWQLVRVKIACATGRVAGAKEIGAEAAFGATERECAARTIGSTSPSQQQLCESKGGPSIKRPSSWCAPPAC